jgi:hypothetical protein
MSLDELSDWQLAGLIDGNPEHPSIPDMQEELERRKAVREERKALVLAAGARSSLRPWQMNL